MLKYNKFIHCTDSHLANKQPEKRTDDFNHSILQKWQWIADYGMSQKVDGIICSGDLCHTHKTSDELIYQFAEIMRNSGLQFYYVYGNHDIQAGNVNYIEKTNMGLLSQHAWFHELDSEKLIEFEHCYLTGINYSHEKECAPCFDWQEGRLKDLNRGDKSKTIVLAVHAMITNKGIMIGGKVKAVDVHDVITNADILLNGHFHDGHKSVVENIVLEHSFKVVNPGSIARMNLKEAKDGFGPRIAVLKIYKNRKSNIKLVDIPCKPLKDIFDLKKQAEQKATCKARDKFIETMSKMSGQAMMGDNFEESIKQVLENPPKKLKKKINKRVRQILLEKLEEHR